jgi:uncharacterized protein YxjI
MREQVVEETILYPLPKRHVCQVSKKQCTSRELKMTVELGGCDMDGNLLDMGFDVNIVLKKYWEVM